MTNRTGIVLRLCDTVSCMRHDKKLPALKLFTVRIAPEQIEEIRRKAKDLNTSLSEVIRRCIEKGLQHLK